MSRIARRIFIRTSCVWFLSRLKTGILISEGSIRTTTHYQHWAVLPVYGYDVAGDPFAIAWDMGYSTYAPGASRVDEYSWKENYYTTNIYSDYLKSFSSGHYFKVMVGFNAELYKTRKY